MNFMTDLPNMTKNNIEQALAKSISEGNPTHDGTSDNVPLPNTADPDPASKKLPTAKDAKPKPMGKKVKTPPAPVEIPISQYVYEADERRIELLRQAVHDEEE